MPQQPLDTYTRFYMPLFDYAKTIKDTLAGFAFFGAPETGARTIFEENAEVGDIDLINADQKTAKLVQRDSSPSRDIAETLGHQTNYKSEARLFPLSRTESVITAGQLNKKQPGEPVHGGWTRQQRLRIVAGRNHMEDIRRTIRLYELIAWEVIRTGKQSAILGTTRSDLIYDYRRDPGNLINVPIAWDGVGPTIMDNLDTGIDQMIATNRGKPDIFLVDKKALAAAINDDTFAKLADNRRFRLVQIGPDLRAPSKYNRFTSRGMDVRGMITTPQGRDLWIFTYEGSHDDDAGTRTPYIQEGEGFLIDTTARFDRQFGPGEGLEMTPQRIEWFRQRFGFSPNVGRMPSSIQNPGGLIDPRMFHVTAWEAEDGSNVKTKTESAPILATTQTNAIVRLTNLVTP